MNDLGTLFSPAMIRALIAGRKTRTRRLASSPLTSCEVGDRLYVRETFGSTTFWEGTLPKDWPDDVPLRYPATDTYINVDRPVAGSWERLRPSIHLPRKFSRMTLVVTGKKIQLLHDITEQEAIEEGLEQHVPPANRGMPHWRVPGLDLPQQVNARMTYAALWGVLHTKPGERWIDNPEVVEIAFDVHLKNIDTL